MLPVSVVIIALNEAKNIAKSVSFLKNHFSDIIIVDSGSSDDTVAIGKSLGCTVIPIRWDGYGKAKNTGNAAAKHDWILSLDADEIPDETLISQLELVNFDNFSVVYDIRFKIYFEKKPINYGNWGIDHHIRLFNRNIASWSDVPVHEDLIFNCPVSVSKLRGHIHHYTISNRAEYVIKNIRYAKLNAIKYFDAGHRATFVKLYLSPIFIFIKDYIVLLGFLDGYAGWLIAKSMVWYTWHKYHCLQEMHLRKYASLGGDL